MNLVIPAMCLVLVICCTAVERNNRRGVISRVKNLESPRATSKEKINGGRGVSGQFSRGVRMRVRRRKVFKPSKRKKMKPRIPLKRREERKRRYKDTIKQRGRQLKITKGNVHLGRYNHSRMKKIPKDNLQTTKKLSKMLGAKQMKLVTDNKAKVIIRVPKKYITNKEPLLSINDLQMLPTYGQTKTKESNRGSSVTDFFTNVKNIIETKNDIKKTENGVKETQKTDAIYSIEDTRERKKK